MTSLVADSRVLGARAITRSLRNPATIAGAVIFPLLFFALFNIVMRRVMEGRGFDYRQLLPPTIVAQAMLFTGMSSTYYVAADRLSGFIARLRSLPIHRAAPIVGRAVGDVTRSAGSVVVVTVVGVITGMRFEAGVAGAAGFVAVALAFAVVVSLAMGLLGYVASSPQAAVSMASIPYLPLLMLSSGFAPVADFPGWLQPFVRWQPVTCNHRRPPGAHRRRRPGRPAHSQHRVVRRPRRVVRLARGQGVREIRMNTAIAESRIFAGRSVRRLARSPETLISTIAFQVVLLLTMLAVFRAAVEDAADGPYAQRLVPALVVSGLMFGSIGTAVGLFTDLNDGFMQRVRSLPIAPAAPLLGIVAAEVVRAVVAVVALAVVGYATGFRFDNGALPALGFVAVAALAAVSIVWIGLALATVVPSQEALAPPLSGTFLVLLFVSGGLVPLDAYPGWAHPIVRNNPATAYVTALDRLARGGAITGPVLVAVAWSIALTALFGTLAVSMLRRRRT